MRHQPCAGSRGFALAELVIASALTAVAVTVLLVEMQEAARASRLANEHLELTARARGGADMLSLALLQGGTGFWASTDSGGRTALLPPVFPARFAVSTSDPELTAFDDRFTAVSSDDERPRLALVSAMADPGSPLMVVPLPGCPAGNATCGLEVGHIALVFDQEGRADVFRVTWILGQWIGHEPAVLSHAYDSSSATRVVGLSLRAFHHVASVSRLNEYRGKAAAMPALDHVVDLRVTYLGEADPAHLPKPPLGIQNCLYTEDGLPKLATLPASVGPWAVLLPAQLADGPACGQSPFRFDADLLRVRAVRLRFRVEAASALVRGADLGAFWNPGLAPARSHWVTDQDITLDLALRTWGGA